MREQAPFYALLAAYVAGKVYVVGFLMSRTPPPDARAFLWTHYHMSLAPGSVLTMIGKYLAFGLGPLYSPTRPPAVALALGALVVALAVVAIVCVLRGWWSGRPLRVAAYGLGLFLVALGPVAVLPAHVVPSYIGLAMSGLALALVGFAAAVPRAPGTMVAGLVTVLLAVHAGSALPRVRQSNEITYYHRFSDQAARWLYTLAHLPPGVAEVVVPNDHVTGMIFGLGDAAAVVPLRPVSCARRARDRARGTGAGACRDHVPVPVLPASCRDWSCVRRGCGAG